MGKKAIKKLTKQLTTMQNQVQLIQQEMQNPLALEDDECIYTGKRKKEHFGRFTAISPLNSRDSVAFANRTNQTLEPDLLDVIGSLSTPALTLLLQCKTVRDDDTNTFTMVDKPKAIAQSSWDKHKKEVRDADLIKCVDKTNNEYMFNPYFIKCWDYKIALTIWNQLP